MTKKDFDNIKLGIEKMIEEGIPLEQILKVFRVAFDEAAIPLIMSAEDGEILLFNKKAQLESGYTFQEVNTLDKWTKAVHKDRDEYNKGFINQNFQQGVTLQGEEEVVYSKDNKVMIWAFHNAVIGKLDDGRNVMVTVCVDVTKERTVQKELSDTLEEVRRVETILKASIESQKEFIIIMLDTEYNYLYSNERHQHTMEMLYHKTPVPGKNIFEFITQEEDKKKEKKRYDRALNGESFSLVDVYGDNHDQFYETYYSPIQTDENEIIGLSIFTSNITEKMNELKRIQESEEKFRLIYSSMSQGLAVHEIIKDEEGNGIDYRYLEVNDSYLEIFGGKRENLIGKRIYEVAPQLEDYWFKPVVNVGITGEPVYIENYSRTIDKYLSAYCYSPKLGQIAVLISDITERVEREKEIQFLSFNDQLTGVYNRRHYEEQLIKLDKKENYPLSMIMGDVNGLKLINDSFGHQIGDKLLIKVANILTKSCRNSDIITRIGGDEFVILLPNTDNIQAKKVIDRIKNYASNETIQNIDVSISFGYGTKHDKHTSLTSLFKQIEDDMYRNKMNDSKSMRSKTIDLIMTTLYEKNVREMFHSKRVGGYCETFAKKLGLENEQINKIKNAGLMHDIGKIGIDEHILNKQGPLTKEEYLEVQKHSEIGYRILSSQNEFNDIANYVLEHHERVDGLGYPNGLMGEEISLQARIINIVDAYDAMTGPRPYKNPVAKEEAINELIKHSGTQFDKDLVQVFINEVLE